MGRVALQRRGVRLAARPLIFVSVAAGLSVLGGSAASAQHTARDACGVERWTVKTLQDRPLYHGTLKTAAETVIANGFKAPKVAERLETLASCYGVD